jgi:hypothetical protein
MGERKPNTNQHEAIAMILDPSPTPPILVIGPFGTGKTFTLSLACESILSQSGRNKVLICTHSNSAADIHLDHLNAKKENKPSLNIQPLRVLNLFRKVHTVPQNLRRYCLIEGIYGTIMVMRKIFMSIFLYFLLLIYLGFFLRIDKRNKRTNVDGYS